MTGISPPDRVDRPSIIHAASIALALLLAIAVIAGGGGSMAALPNLAVQLTALIVLGLHRRSAAGFVRSAPLGLRWLVAATLALPLIQLVPLPPSLWIGLPGRDLLAGSLDLAGGRSWYPMSLEPARTFLGATGLLAPFAVLAIAFGLSPHRLASLQAALVGLGVAAALFGSLHLHNDHWGDLYAWQRPLPGILVGTFADRNGAALFFVGCLLLLIGLPAYPRSPMWRFAAVMGGAFLALAVVLTGSRTGMALLALPAVLGCWRAVRSYGPGNKVALALAGGALLAAIAVGLIAVGSSGGRLATSLDRFGESDGMRAEMREDAVFAAQHFWPVGTGIGTFDAVFQVDESLEYVSPRRAGHAHMDYYELAIEAGLAGLVLLAGWLGWAAWLGWRAVRRPGAWAARAAVLFAAGIAAQSLLSFPLRSQAMLCLLAFAIVLMARSPVVETREQPL